MCIMDRYDLPGNPNKLLSNQSKGRISVYGMVSDSRDIDLFVSIYAYAIKITDVSKSASTMIYEY